MQPLRGQQRRKHRVPRRITSHGPQSRADEDHRANTEPTHVQREQTDAIRAQIRHRPVPPLTGDRPLLAPLAAAGNGQGPPVLQPDGGRAPQGEDKVAGEVSGGRVRRRPDVGQAAGVRADADPGRSPGGSAVRQCRVPWDRSDRRSTGRCSFDFYQGVRLILT